MQVARGSSNPRLIYSLFFVFFVFIEFYPEPIIAEKTVKNGEIGPSVDNLEFWMTQLSESLRARPIIHLAIPGSHDTMTYTIELLSGASPDVPAKLAHPLIRFLKWPLVIVHNWAVTQSANVQEQLNGGIRYLDLRIATRPQTESFYFVHGQYGAATTEPLKSIASWLDFHPKEIVILDFQHLHAFTVNDHLRFIAEIKSIFGNKLCPTGDPSQMSLNWFATNKYQVIVIYENDEILNSDNLLWPRSSWPTPWPQTVNTTILLEHLDSGLKNRSPDTGFISQCVLTPDHSYIANNLKLSLEILDESIRPVILPWIDRQNIGPGGINIVIADYVQYNRFIFSRIVIQRNC